jgi:molybdopterin/thiamine biosynthesis adenylyltransferase/rhodanese-related sulfurtransferase
MLNKQELEKYSRHLILPEVGLEGQLKLKAARVLVVGAGGLGCPVLLYLAAAGVGRIGIADYDKVSNSNLQRQVLYEESDIGQSKSKVAASKLQKLNSQIQVDHHIEIITSVNILELIPLYDIIVDATDNFPVRYLLNDACIITGKPLVYGSIYRFEGQVSVFNVKNDRGEFSANYRDLYPVPPHPSAVPDCSEGGVLGILPGIIGSIQATEVIKIITCIGNVLANKLLIYNLLDHQMQTINYTKRNGQKPITQLIDYEEFCNSGINEIVGIKSIKPHQLKEMLDKQQSFTLIDVREAYEREITHIGGLHQPLSQIAELTDNELKHNDVVVYCRTGKRSSKAIEALKTKFPEKKFISLDGGILAWIDKVDTSLPRY